MRLKVHPADLYTFDSIVILSGDDCLELGVDVNDSVRISGASTIVSSVLISDSAVKKGDVVMPVGVMQRCEVSEGDYVEVEYSPLPESVKSIRKKINGGRLDRKEIDSIVRDIQNGGLSDKEILAFVSAFNVNNADIREIADLTRSMAATGVTADLGISDLYDFHSLGGVPGNKITPIVVSIVASKGLVIPKLSSRAISSACGTSDFVETFCDVEMDIDTLRAAVSEAGGVFACGNNDYAPVGRRIIRAERPMGIDPRPTMLASIMSKKVALGTNRLLIDIPMGAGSKITDIGTATDCAKDIIGLGRELGICVECAVTSAEQPIGRSVGPILEARECIEILENGDGNSSVVEKACGLAGMLFDMAGIDNGQEVAKEILRSGEAYGKFLDIVRVQNGSVDPKASDMSPGRYVRDIHAKRSGFVQYVDNPCIVAIAKGAGAPVDKGAGVELLHKKGDRVECGEVLFRIYAENQAKLDRATESARSRRPMYVSQKPVVGVFDRMIIRRVKGSNC